jgi:hypothetical protein
LGCCYHDASFALTEKKEILAIDIARATVEERFSYWFPAEHRHALEGILGEILLVSDEYFRTFFLCGFSNILRRSSIWLSGSTKPQKDLEKCLSDPLEEFQKQIRDMLRRNALYWSDFQMAGIDPHQASRIAADPSLRSSRRSQAGYASSQ